MISYLPNLSKHTQIQSLIHAKLHSRSVNPAGKDRKFGNRRNTRLGPLFVATSNRFQFEVRTHPVHTVIGACSVTECVECSQGLSHPPSKKTPLVFMIVLSERTKNIC